MEEIRCRRCGKCCYIKEQGKLTSTPCKWLVFHKNGLTSCRIYGNRLNKDLGNGNRCVNRVDFHFNINGCSYNQEGWPNLETVEEENGKEKQN